MNEHDTRPSFTHMLFLEHEYVRRFRSGVRLSIGFDGHRVEDYRPDRVVNCCEALKKLGLPLVFEE